MKSTETYYHNERKRKPFVIRFLNIGEKKIHIFGSKLSAVAKYSNALTFTVNKTKPPT